MRVGIVKLGFNKISFAPNKRVTNGNLGEIELIIRLFTENNCKITLCDTQIKAPDIEAAIESVNTRFKVEDTKHFSTRTNLHDELEADILVVIGGTVNFFGGSDGSCILNSYHVINNFKGKVYYFYSDPLCTLQKSVGREGIKRDDESIPFNIELTRPITLINCAKTFDVEAKPWNAKNVYTEFNQIIAFEFSKSSIFGPVLKSNFAYKDVDLVYGGFYRSGKRRKQMMEYLFNTGYSSRFFGGMELEDFAVKEKENITIFPDFEKKTGDWNFFKKETNRAYATIVFAEDTYQDNITTMRVYYSVLSGTLVLIDGKYDSAKLLFNKDFFYVNNKEDVQKRLDVLKSLSTEKYQELLDYQYKCLNIDKSEYYQSFWKLIN